MLGQCRRRCLCSADSGDHLAAAGQVASLSIFIPRARITRVLHSRLTGEFIELQGKQKLPLRLPAAGWTDLDVVCDQLGIPRS